MNSLPLPDSAEYDFIRGLAKEYNVTVRVAALDDGIKGYKMDDAIVLNENILPERRNWTFCHELAHIVLGHSAKPSDDEEREADALAAETMLPQRDFIPDSHELNLSRLKEIYPQASYEVLARRCLQFHQAVLTIFDQERLSTRIGSAELAFPVQPTKEELSVMKECYRHKENFSSDMKKMKIAGFYIDLGLEVVRVILISRPDPIDS